MVPQRLDRQPGWEEMPMHKTVINKLHSRKGASITFALLAFLVCAVISAVLIAAGLASSGRVSGLAKSDRRYYAVTSAAQLFCDTLNDQTFRIEQTMTLREREETTFTINPDGGFTQVGDPDVSKVPPDKYGLTVQTPYATYSTEDRDGVDADISGLSLKSKSFLTEAALYYVFGEVGKAEQVNVDTFVGKTFSTTNPHTYNYPRTWEMKLDVGGQDFLTVDVEVTMSDTGDIELKFCNDEGADKFYMVVELRAIVTDSTITKTPRNVGSGNTPGDPYFVTWIETETDTVKTTEICWKVTEVKKVSA